MGLYRRGKIFWFSMMRDGKRIQVSTKTDNKRRAEHIYAKALTDFQEGQLTRKHADVSLEEAIGRYMSEVAVLTRPNTRSRYSQIAKGLVSFMGNYLLKDLSSSVVSSYKTKRLREVRPGTVHKELRFLRAVFNAAIDEWELAERNPVKKVIKKLKFNDKRVRYLKPEERHALEMALPSWLRPVVLVLSQTGLRRGDVISLTWSQIDFREGLIFVPKTKNDDPVTVPMTNAVRETLLKLSKIRRLSGYVFCDDQGRPHAPHKVSMAFRRACERAGIENLRLHDLRHDFASMLVRGGVDLYRVQKLLGHRDGRMTQRYAHLVTDDLREAVKAIDRENICYNFATVGDEKRGHVAITP